MAKKTIVASVNSKGDIDSNAAQNPYDAVSAISAITAAYATLATNIATLVTDGGSPTQAHVTTLAATWVTLKAVLDGIVAAAASAATSFNVGVLIQVDAVKVPVTTPVDAPRLMGQARG